MCHQTLGQLDLGGAAKSAAYLSHVLQSPVMHRSHENAVDTSSSKPIADNHAGQDLCRLDLLPGARALAGPVHASQVLGHRAFVSLGHNPCEELPAAADDIVGIGQHRIADPTE